MTRGCPGLPEGMCLCVCFCAKVRPWCKDFSQSWPKVGVVRVKHWDDLKVWGKRAYRTRMEVWDFTIKKLGLTKMVDNTMMAGRRFVGNSDVFKNWLHSKMYLFWPRDPFILSCYWVKLHPRRLYNSPKSIPAESIILCWSLNTRRRCKLNFVPIGAWGRTDGWGPGPGSREAAIGANLVIHL